MDEGTNRKLSRRAMLRATLSGAGAAFLAACGAAPTTSPGTGTTAVTEATVAPPPEVTTAATTAPAVTTAPEVTAAVETTAAPETTVAAAETTTREGAVPASRPGGQGATVIGSSVVRRRAASDGRSGSRRALPGLTRAPASGFNLPVEGPGSADDDG